METFRIWLAEQGLSPNSAAIVIALFAAVVVLLVATLAYLVAKKIILRLVRSTAKRTKTHWDDALVESKVFARLALLVPGVVVHVMAASAFADYPTLVSSVKTAAFVYVAVVAMSVFDALLDGVLKIYRTHEVSKRVPINPFLQVLRIAVYFVGGIVILAILLGKSPVVLFSGLGAFTAVLMLIFKDSILNFVAGLQLISNNMVRRGDWIEMPRYGADGDVVEVSLNTVKVQNWDKTISTVPTYALITDSFKNWRGMEESGGRRIKRAVHIDVTSIKFCDTEMLERFKRIQFITEYVQRKLDEVTEYNKEHVDDDSLLVNGRHLTNVGTFRAYLEAYLRHHPKINQGMTFLVRQLAPGERGLPIEIYVFSSDQAWANYEAIQAGIFDHILAVIPLFDLRVFQTPTGADMRALSGLTGPGRVAST
jgi:miniconductance mechanosensitive channel